MFYNDRCIFQPYFVGDVTVLPSTKDAMAYSGRSLLCFVFMRLDNWLCSSWERVRAHQDNCSSFKGLCRKKCHVLICSAKQGFQHWELQFSWTIFKGTREQTNFEGICGKAAMPLVQSFSQFCKISFWVYSFEEGRSTPLLLFEIAVIK